jgi:hypothetical protein
MKKSIVFKSTLILFLSTFFFASSCKKKDKVPIIFTFNLNNQKVDCSKSFGFSDRVISDQSIIWGRNDNFGIVNLVLDTTVVGSFTQSDYESSLKGYAVNFTNTDDVYYSYSNNNPKGYFNIKVKTYNNDEISGTFSAKLFDLTNDSDSVMIEEGVFSYGF